MSEANFTGRKAKQELIMFFVYILLSEIDGKFYIGFAEDVQSRLEAHNSGKVESTRYRKPFRLVYYEAYINEDDARGREVFLKSGSGHNFLKKQMRHFMNDLNMDSRGGAVR